jgi:intracellular sulfur oxidation DsrE/DsrF family protein
MKRLSFVAFAVGLCLSTGIAQAAQVKEPYGSGTFGTFKDIDSLKQLKAVFDVNFQDPAGVGLVLNNIAALMRAATQYGPKSMNPVSIVVVSHGPELVVWDKRNYRKFKAIVDRAASMAEQGVKFEVCRNAAAALHLKPADLDGFITVIPAGPYALAYWQNKGYAVINGGTTRPSAMVTRYNRDDVSVK